MAEGPGRGGVKPVTVTDSGREGSREARQACVMDEVEFGLMRRIEMGGWGVPEMGGVNGEE